MNKMMISLFMCFTYVGSATCESVPLNTLVKSYQYAVEDASKVHATEISRHLFSVSHDNKKLIWENPEDEDSRILVLTWKSQSDYEQYVKSSDQTSDQENYVTWVTLAPQVRQLCQSFQQKNPEATKEDIDLRLKQYLGLSHTWNYDVFIEMWVSPEDLVRPCVDPEVSDTQCNLKFTSNIPNVKNINNYEIFFKNLYYKSYRFGVGVPWTGLGYAYDWGSSGSEVGASEYVLSPKSDYEIKKVTKTMDYCTGKVDRVLK
ncbi:MAG: hypothetical protein Q9M28_08695 [Mariprofundaceae bacterium]|nr:hypothetical protein [Mariprofundaceae bacterium]